jgi:hypothetical protein
VSKFGTFHRPGRVAPVSLLIIAAGVGILASSTLLPVLIAAGALGGFGLGLFISHIGPLLLRSSPQEHMSRVQALIGLVQSAALLVTNNLLGGVAQLSTPRYSAVICAALLVIAALGAYSSRSFRDATF